MIRKIHKYSDTAERDHLKYEPFPCTKIYQLIYLLYILKETEKLMTETEQAN